METVIIVIHLMVVLALVGVVLLQRSEGGGLGIGGGSGFMTARGAANALTRATAILAAAFFITSLGLSLLARYGAQPIDILDRVPPAGQDARRCPRSAWRLRRARAARHHPAGFGGNGAGQLGRSGIARSSRRRTGQSARNCSGCPAGERRGSRTGHARRAAGSEPVVRVR